MSRATIMLAWSLVAALMTSGLAFGTRAEAQPHGSIPAATNDADVERPVKAPLNPEFVRYIETPRANRVLPLVSGRRMGVVPEPVDLSHAKGHKINWPMPILEYPSQFDLRTLGRLPPVRDQGACATCWAFASLASLESALWPNEPWDFSENNLKNKHGFTTSDYCENNGGWLSMAIAYMARWDGPKGEYDDPYHGYEDQSPAGIRTVKHLQEALYLPPRAGTGDNDNIKGALMNLGAVAAYTCFMESSYDDANHSYYFTGAQKCVNFNGKETESNHAIAIVGWDDNFGKNNFNTTPPGDGAFIARNSWGKTWGEEGYFYVSYYDHVIGNSMYAYYPRIDLSGNLTGAEDANNYRYIYQYDILGWNETYGYKSSPTPETAWIGNVFTPANEDRELLKAVGFYTVNPDASYEVYVYDGVQGYPTAGSLVGWTAGLISAMGYHTIGLDSLGVTLTKGQDFSVVVKVTTPGYSYPIAVEEYYPGLTEGAANSGRSFVSRDGTNWWNLSRETADQYGAKATNACLKAFTVPICDDGNECTEDVFDGALCTHQNKAAATQCDDGNPGTKNNACDGAGGCAGEEYVCPSGGTCMAYVEPDGNDCFAVPEPYEPGSEPQRVTACDDGKNDTKDDHCDGTGKCSGTPYVCTPGPCEETSVHNGKDCTVTLKAAGVSCDDGNKSTKGDVCDDSGDCVGTPYVCTPTQCEESSVPNGADCAITYKPAGSSCDDADDSTRNDACDGAGGCAGISYSCTPTQCETASIPNGTGCTTTVKPAGTPCDDSNAFTRNDRCDVLGNCVGLHYTCTPTQCEALSAPNGADCTITFKSTGAPCDDGNPATTVDTCDGAGACVGTTAPAGGADGGGDATAEDTSQSSGCSCTTIGFDS